MKSTKCVLLSLSLCLCLSVAQAAAKDFLPAGTLLQCTIDEPNFSSKTAAIGDPVLCHLGYVSEFGHSVFPRGAYLSGHLQDYRDPGHFVGKGNLQVEFDRLLVPNGEVLPLSAKIISVPHYKVDREGKIRGRGHPKRDAIEWAIPILWPIKVLTLPARGPFPTLKGEVRITLRLMEDVEVPPVMASRASVPRASVPMPPWASPARLQSSAATWGDDSPILRQANTVSPTPRLTSDQPPETRKPAAILENPSEPRPTLLALRDSTVMLASDYWLEGEQLHWITRAAQEKLLPLSMLDLSETVRLNTERNVSFKLHSKETNEY